MNGVLQLDSAAAAAATPTVWEDIVIEFNIGHVDFIIDGSCQAYVTGDNDKLIIKDLGASGGDIWIHLDSDTADSHDPRTVDDADADNTNFKVREEGNRIIIEHQMTHIVNVREEDGRLIIERRSRDVNPRLSWHRP
jgi:hypothetical protein